MVLAALLSACGTSAPEPLPENPYVVVLGTAQDGGFPQIGAYHPLAQAARADRSRRRLVASLLLVDPRTGSRWLIDATPDLREQVDLVQGHPPTRVVSGPRPPLFEGIFLTHAHMGHYSGLVHLGREAYNAVSMPVYASARMGQFLTDNGPWELMVRLEQIELHTLQPDQPVTLGEDLSITPFLVPHRPEYSDTFGFRIDGPDSSLIYIPDIDKWELWERRVEDEIAQVDVALLDGSFFGNDEVPGRDMSEIPHPFIEESMARFTTLPPEECAKIWFTHLNHTNPASAPDGAVQRRIRAAGFAVAVDGQIIRL